MTHLLTHLGDNPLPAFTLLHYVDPDKAGHAGGSFPRPDVHERLDRVNTFGTENQADLPAGCEAIARFANVATFSGKLTGFNLSVLGDIPFEVDGKPVHWPDTVTYRGMMFTDVPNLLWVFGYFRASWTLRADLIGDKFREIRRRHGARGHAARPARGGRARDAGERRGERRRALRGAGLPAAAAPWHAARPAGRCRQTPPPRTGRGR